MHNFPRYISSYVPTLPDNILTSDSLSRALPALSRKITYLHRISKKTVKNYFCQNFFKSPQTVKIFSTWMDKRM